MPEVLVLSVFTREDVEDQIARIERYFLGNHKDPNDLKACALYDTGLAYRLLIFRIFVADKMASKDALYKAAKLLGKMHSDKSFNVAVNTIIDGGLIGWDTILKLDIYKRMTAENQLAKLKQYFKEEGLVDARFADAVEVDVSKACTMLVLGRLLHPERQGHLKLSRTIKAAMDATAGNLELPDILTAFYEVDATYGEHLLI